MYAPQERSTEDALARGGISILGNWSISRTRMQTRGSQAVIERASQRPIDAELSVYVAFGATSALTPRAPDAANSGNCNVSCTAQKESKNENQNHKKTPTISLLPGQSISVF